MLLLEEFFSKWKLFYIAIFSIIDFFFPTQSSSNCIIFEVKFNI